WPEDPKVSDRIALFKSYLGNALLQWFRALRAPKAHRFAYAWGYTLGAVKGIFSPPRASRLMPEVDWLADAERTLAESRKMLINMGASQISAAWLNANTLFPLTPALSLRERENSPQSVDTSKASACEKTDEASSLSLGERVGVRGNSAGKRI